MSHRKYQDGTAQNTIMRKRGRNYILWRMKYVRKACPSKTKTASSDFRTGSGRTEGERAAQIDHGPELPASNGQNPFFLHFVWFCSCLRQEGNYSLCYFILVRCRNSRWNIYSSTTLVKLYCTVRSSVFKSWLFIASYMNCSELQFPLLYNED